jgi:hypothetical protein
MRTAPGRTVGAFFVVPRVVVAFFAGPSLDAREG